MKKVFKLLVGLLFLALILTICYFIFREPIHKLFNKVTKPSVVIETYLMDPDTNEYKLELTKEVKVEKGATYEVTPNEIEYYDLDEKSILKVENINQKTTLKLYYNCEKCVLSFDPNGGTINGDTIYTINKGQKFFCPEIKRTGYQIKQYLNYSERIYTDTQIIIEWEEAHFQVTLCLPSDCAINDPLYKKIEGTNNYQISITYFETLDLPTIISYHYILLYWKDDLDNHYYSLENVSEDITLYPSLNVQLYIMSFVEENEEHIYQNIVAQTGEHINAPKIDPLYQIPGYGLNWYSDEAYTTKYIFDVMPHEDTTLYGKWEIDTGCGFLDYNINKPTIDNLEEFTKCIDYVYFNYIEESDNFEREITYVPYEKVTEEFEKASKLAEYRSNTTLRIGIREQSFGLSKKVYVHIYNITNAKEYEATKTTPYNDKTPYNYVGYNELTNQRSASFNDFYIERLQETFSVSTTNQLLYVVEHGYKPICGGKALTIYNKAKDVLRNIVNDEMSDLEKIERIFAYLVLNVQYDYNVLDATDDWENYDAYFMEGVFLNKKAVCDGIAKSLVLLASIEGIPCVEVSGNHHAWCEVKINNVWYVIDATHGNLSINGTTKTVLDYSEFLISHALKEEKGYKSSEFVNIRCDYFFDYFSYYEYPLNHGTIKLYVEDASDLEKVLEYCDEKVSDLTGYSIDIEIKEGLDLGHSISEAQTLFYTKNHKIFTNGISWSFDETKTRKIVKLLFQ